MADITLDPRLGKANNLTQGEWEVTMYLQAVAASGKHGGIMSHAWCSRRHWSKYVWARNKGGMVHSMRDFVTAQKGRVKS